MPGDLLFVFLVAALSIFVATVIGAVAAGLRLVFRVKRVYGRGDGRIRDKWMTFIVVGSLLLPVAMICAYLAFGQVGA